MPFDPDFSHAELHARPFPVIERPALLWFHAQFHDPADTSVEAIAEYKVRENQHLLGFPYQRVEAIAERCFNVACTEGELRVERHYEFTSYTWIHRHPNPLVPFVALDDALQQWFNNLPGTCLTRLRLAVVASKETTPQRTDLVPLLGDHQLCGSLCSDAAAAIWSTFKQDEDHWMRFLIHDFNLQSDRRCGRLCQRLIESEVYRVLSLMSLPQGRKLQQKLDEMESRLTEAFGSFNATEAQAAQDKILLTELSSLAIDVERQRAAYAKRASATEAYARIARERLRDLRQQKIMRFQSLSEFLDRRVEPALQTIKHSALRLEQLSLRLDRASDLLRTRVDITIEEQNTQLLHSLDQRAEAQMRMQETVEGLSVVAISYYLVGLCAYLLSGLKSMGLPLDKDIALLIAAPFIAVLVWMSVRKIRNAFKA